MWATPSCLHWQGPGEYMKLPDTLDGLNGGRFGEARPKSDLEWTIARAKKMPGPAEYETKIAPLPGTSHRSCCCVTLYSFYDNQLKI